MPETESQLDKKRLSFNQKFWLICIGVLLLLVATFLIIVIIVPKPLNSTEQKLLGKWEAVSPATNAGEFIEFEPGYAISEGKSPNLWSANINELSTSVIGDYELLERIKLGLGLDDALIWKIDVLTEEELQIREPKSGYVIRLRRIKPTQP